MESAPQSHPHAICLEVSDGSSAPERLSLMGPRLVIGRVPECQVHLDRNTVSRRHAEIFCDPFERWFIRDLGSRNGTRVNGKTGPEHPLQTGDWIGVGEFTLRVVSLGRSGPDQEPSTMMTGSVAISDAASHIKTLSDLDPPRLAASHLALLNELGQKLLAMEDAQQRLAELCRMFVREEFHSQCAMVLRLSKSRPGDEPALLCQPEVRVGAQGKSMHISRSVLRTLLHKESPLVASNASMEVAAEISISPDVQAISAIACPIRRDSETLDALYTVLPPQYGTGEWLALATLACKQFEQAEAAWIARKQQAAHAAIERELSRARDIQVKVLPTKLSIPGLDLAIGFKPCRWVGGDYADALMTKDGRVLLVVADVCGKGMPAALVASALHSTIRMGVRSGMRLGEIMFNLAEHIQETEKTPFVTMCCVLIDPGSGEVECINAGHPPALVLRAGEAARPLQSGQNTPLGVEPQPLTGQFDALKEGEALVIYTDGLPDLQKADGKALGMEELHARLAGIMGAMSASELAGRITAMLDEVQGSSIAPDDRTFLVARRK